MIPGHPCGTTGRSADRWCSGAVGPSAVDVVTSQDSLDPVVHVGERTACAVRQVHIVPGSSGNVAGEADAVGEVAPLARHDGGRVGAVQPLDAVAAQGVELASAVEYWHGDVVGTANGVTQQLRLNGGGDRETPLLASSYAIMPGSDVLGL